MNLFNLRKHAPEPEPAEEIPDDTEEQPSDGLEPTPAPSPTSWRGALWAGICGPGAWIAARFGTGTAWTVHGIAVWACFFYDGWLPLVIPVGWLLLVLAFTPKQYLDQLTAWVEHRIGPGHADSEAGRETSDEPAGEEAAWPDPQDVVDLVRDVIGDDRGALLTALRGPLHAADTKAVREVLTAANIRVREGVRTGRGNGPGVHRDDLPHASPELKAADGERCLPSSSANTNANNTIRVQSREGMTIITDPADRHRTHTLSKP